MEDWKEKINHYSLMAILAKKEIPFGVSLYLLDYKKMNLQLTLFKEEGYDSFCDRRNKKTTLKILDIKLKGNK